MCLLEGDQAVRAAWCTLNLWDQGTQAVETGSGWGDEILEAMTESDGGGDGAWVL